MIPLHEGVEEGPRTREDILLRRVLVVDPVEGDALRDRREQDGGRVRGGALEADRLRVRPARADAEGYLEAELFGGIDPDGWVALK